MEHKKTKYLTILGVKYTNLNVNFSFIEIKQYHTCRNTIISMIKAYYFEFCPSSYTFTTNVLIATINRCQTTPALP